ncbi:hypothetical protein Pst134EA_017594 [Puccinia striiformis f. sp. tritici]|uniref:hypothetical protein n=1 Tax=Puccinia striiformis f. sp. tritici TaxID=168172 RepID=UPI0020081C08|nr:hypothetical protein Pst134EA_017594 [Puccinia striiformis f. sp. tritici]KAH9461287.1 hypothetical protein Pst134EA_017594 [Puccinia striiformis f. sp. tritici]
MNPDGFWSTHAHPELNLKLRVKDLAKMTSQALLVVRPMYHHSRPVDHPQRTSEDQQEPSRTGPTTDYLNRINLAARVDHRVLSAHSRQVDGIYMSVL